MLTLQELYKNSLYLTSRFLLGYQDINPHTHSDMVTALESVTPRKLIVMPRGTFKSSIASVAFPVWLLIRDPNERILIDSEIYGNSKNFLREIAAHYEGDAYRRVFGETKGGTWNEGELTIRQRTRILKEASITASGIGAEKTSQHYTTIIMDDLNSQKNSGTREGREKVINHYRYNTALLEPGGVMVLVGTRYAADDAIGFCLSNEIGR